MRAVLQRVSQAAVTVNGETVAEIGSGLAVLLCVENGDAAADAALFACKIAAMRIFEDDAGKMNRSVLDVSGAALVVSQFTLAGEWRKGNRPSFSGAARPEVAEPLMQEVCDGLRGAGVPVATGVFGARMAVHLVNDGPVTIWMDSRAG